VASNFARRFIVVQGRESPIFVNFALPTAQDRTKRQAPGPRTPLQYIARSRIGMCGYRSVAIDVLVYVKNLFIACFTGTLINIIVGQEFYAHLFGMLSYYRDYFVINLCILL